MSLVRSFCGPLSPRDAYWTDLLPDQASFRASQGKVLAVFILHLLCVVLPTVVVNMRVLLQFLEGGGSMEFELSLANQTFGNFVISCTLSMYVLSTSLVRGRRIVYFLDVFVMLISEIIAAFVNPVSMTSLYLEIFHRVVLICGWSLARSFVFQKVVCSHNHWFLLSLLIYLIRFFSLSVEEDSFPDLPVAASLLHSMSVVVLTIFVQGIQWCARRRFNQVQTTGSTTPPVPNATVGKVLHLRSISALPYDSSEVDEAGRWTTVVPGMIEAIGKDEDQLDGDETKDEHEEVHETQFHVAPSYESADEGRRDCEEAMEAGQLTTVVPEMLEAIGNEEDQLDGKEAEDEHEEVHKTQFYVIDEAQVHEDEPPQVLQAVVPVNGETPSPPPEAPVEPPALGAQGSNPSNINMTVYTVGGLCCQHQILDSDQYVIYDLKSLVGAQLGTNPRKIMLLRQQTGEVLHDSLQVARLATETRTDRLFFSAVISEAHMREQCMVEGSGYDGSWPSVSYYSERSSDNVKEREI